MTLSNLKQRTGAKFASMDLSFRLVESGSSLVLDAAVVETPRSTGAIEVAKHQQILQLLADVDPFTMTRTALASAAGGNKQAALKILAKMIEEGVAVRAGDPDDGGTAPPHTPAGRRRSALDAEHAATDRGCGS